MATTVRPLRRDDLDEADRVFRLAFGTFLGLPNPLAFAGDADYVRSRWHSDPAGAFAADHDGVFAGSVFALSWGTVGFFGPLSVRPELWSRGIAQRLLVPVMERFSAAQVTHAGLFTFAQSAKHVGLYGKLGFHPRFLTAVMAKPVATRADAAAVASYGRQSPAEREATLASCRAISDTLYPGLDLTFEIRAVTDLGFGDTALLHEDGALAGFAVCHLGAGTEAGSNVCYVKFGAIDARRHAAERFAALLEACETFAGAAGVATLLAGVNLGRDQAYDAMRRRGFRTIIQGVAMHRPNEPGYSRPDVFALDDWR